MPDFIGSKQERNVCVGQCQIKSVNEDQRTIELSFSSDVPYLRSWGYEVLSHGSDAVDMTRLENGAALLAEHDGTKQIGVVERAWIDGNKGRAVVRFSKNSPLANEYYGDVKDGIRKNISVGYAVNDAEKTGERDGEDVWTVTKWLPFEISVVSVPADISVGVGRSKEKRKGDHMPKEIKEEVESTETRATETPAIDVQKERAEAMKQAREEELSRAKEINAIASSFGKQEMATKAIEEGVTVDAFRVQVLDTFKPGKQVDTKSGFIGLDTKEIEQFSFTRALAALANPNDHRAQDAAGYEYEVSRAAQKASGLRATGIMIPMDVMSRTLTTASADGGDHLVATDLQAANFINLLRNRSAVIQSATILNGLVGNLTIPKQTSAMTVENQTETGAATESDLGLDEITLSPRRATGNGTYSDQILHQSSIDVENLIKMDLLCEVTLKIDYNALNGDGTGNMPIGIRNATGVNVLALGTNGVAPTWANFVNLETLISDDNADVEQMLYLMNSKGRGYVKTKEKVSGYPQFIAGDNGMINGYGYRVSNQVPRNLTKGSGTNLSNITFGNFADLLIGFWGGVDLNVDSTSHALRKDGKIGIAMNVFYDVAVRRPESFAIIEDAII